MKVCVCVDASQVLLLHVCVCGTELHTVSNMGTQRSNIRFIPLSLGKVH